MATSTETARQIAAIVHSDGGRLLAVLTGLLRNFELAEDCLQEAYGSAIEHWERGPPVNPQGWLLQVARRKAIDRLRRANTARAKEGELTHLLQIENEALEANEDFVIPDERLKLIFTCCHPALEKQSSVALTLRTVCGLTTEQIAKAFLVARETMAQRLVRAQRKITAAGIPFAIPEPDQFGERLAAVLDVIYLIFNAGYGAAIDLCDEAIHSAKIVEHLLPQEPEVKGLLALMQLHKARFATRLDETGTMICLEDQDRSKWDRALITASVEKLMGALSMGKPGPLQMQAAISAIHCEAESFAATNWSEIVLIYDRMFALNPSPVIALNRVVAVSFASGPEEAIADLEELKSELANYQPYHAARADMLTRLQRHAAAAKAYERAIALSEIESERKFLRQKLPQTPL